MWISLPFFMSRVDFSAFSVFRFMVAKILDISEYVPDKVKSSAGITLHQFVSYFKAEGGLHNVETIAEQCKDQGLAASVTGTLCVWESVCVCVSLWGVGGRPVSYTHLTLPTNVQV